MQPASHRGMAQIVEEDPAERRPILRFLYRGWRPTRLGRVVNRIAAFWTVHGPSSQTTAVLEVRGRSSGRTRSTPVVVASVGGTRYLVSILGPGSGWVKNVEAAGGAAVLRQARPECVQLSAVPSQDRAPILREYVRIATSGRHHFPIGVDAPLSAFAAIANRYPVYRIEPSTRTRLEGVQLRSSG